MLLLFAQCCIVTLVWHPSCSPVPPSTPVVFLQLPQLLQSHVVGALMGIPLSGVVLLFLLCAVLHVCYTSSRPVPPYMPIDILHLQLLQHHAVDLLMGLHHLGACIALAVCAALRSWYTGCGPVAPCHASYHLASAQLLQLLHNTMLWVS